VISIPLRSPDFDFMGYFANKGCLWHDYRKISQYDAFWSVELYPICFEAPTPLSATFQKPRNIGMDTRPDARPRHGKRGMPTTQS
jgi:hypothetical protein